MRHPTTDALELQMDSLLRSAAGFEPEMEAPFDLVERAMQRATRRVASVRIQRPIVALLWGGAAGAAAASAAAAFLIASPPTQTEPLEPRQASIGLPTPSYRAVAEIEPGEPAPKRSRRPYRVRYAPPRARPAEEAPAQPVSWQTEEIEQTVEQTVRPALRLRFNEEGQPVDLQAGLLETLTVSENPSACGSPDAETTAPGNEIDETSGEGRAKEANLPSKED